MSDLEKIVAAQTGPPSLKTSLIRGMAIARHYSWLQIFRRGKNVAGQRLFGATRIGSAPDVKRLSARDSDERCDRETWIKGGLNQSVFLKQIEFRSEQSSSVDLHAGQFKLLNQKRRLGEPAEWPARLPKSGATHLWRFQLHYHEYLLSVARAKSRDGENPDHDFNDIWKFLESWLQTYRPDSATYLRDAWHPYCISRRVPVWINLLALANPSSQCADNVARHLVWQLEHLNKNLETDLGGNHLIENLAALAIAGLTLDVEQCTSWLHTATTGLAIEISKQILPHGEHFELSPMYHCQILAQLLRIASLSTTDQPLHQLCLTYGQRMFDFLNATVHPDGEIPLFGDSGFGETPSVAEIRELAMSLKLKMERPAESQAVGPYQIFRHGSVNPDRSEDSNLGSFLIFDRGEVAARQLPAHGHCDLLNLEASIDGQRWIVDSGNFNYEDDSMRQFCRSSLAHNVLTVGRLDQCDVWSKFRMGRRGKITSASSDQNESWHWARAAHNAWQHLGVTSMERVVAAHNDQVWICADFVSGDFAPEVFSKKIDRPLVGYLHLHPDIRVEPVESSESEDAWSYFLTNMPAQSTPPIARRVLRFFGVSHVRIVSGWYCEAFGVRRQNLVIEYQQADYQHRPLGWMLSPENIASSVTTTKFDLQIDSATPISFTFSSNP